MRRKKPARREILRRLRRILQKKTGHVYSAEKIINALNRVSLFSCQSQVDKLGKRRVWKGIKLEDVGVDFKKKYRRLGEMKKSLGNVKKT